MLERNYKCHHSETAVIIWTCVQSHSLEKKVVQTSPADGSSDTDLHTTWLYNVATFLMRMGKLFSAIFHAGIPMAILYS